MRFYRKDMPIETASLELRRRRGDTEISSEKVSEIAEIVPLWDRPQVHLPLSFVRRCLVACFECTGIEAAGAGQVFDLGHSVRRVPDPVSRRQARDAVRKSSPQNWNHTSKCNVVQGNTRERDRLHSNFVPTSGRLQNVLQALKERIEMQETGQKKGDPARSVRTETDAAYRHLNWQETSSCSSSSTIEKD
eukprot:74386_1